MTRSPLAPLRKIVKREPYTTKSHPHGTFSVALTLECGHKKHLKGSQCPESQKRARCRECIFEPPKRARKK